VVEQVRRCHRGPSSISVEGTEVSCCSYRALSEAVTGRRRCITHRLGPRKADPMALGFAWTEHLRRGQQDHKRHRLARLLGGTTIASGVATAACGFSRDAHVSTSSAVPITSRGRREEQNTLYSGEVNTTFLVRITDTTREPRPRSNFSTLPSTNDQRHGFLRLEYLERRACTVPRMSSPTTAVSVESR
jgi:hypothetical protein